MISFLSLLTFVCALIVSALAAEVCPAANVCYAYDQSGSVSYNDFELEKRIVVQSAKDFRAESGGSVFSAVKFDTRSNVVSAPTSDIRRFESDVMRSTRSAGGTFIGSGLDNCASLLSGMSEPRFIVLFTDGFDSSSYVSQTTSIANRIKADNIDIATVGVGRANEQQLKNIASDPEYYVYASDFSELQTKMNELLKTLCSIPKKSCCADTAFNADRFCPLDCFTYNDCPVSQDCFETENPPPVDRKCCGATQFEASQCTVADCLTSSDCRGNQLCWNVYSSSELQASINNMFKSIEATQVTVSKQSAMTKTAASSPRPRKCCGDTAYGANEFCPLECFTPFDCPVSQDCFDTTSPPTPVKKCCGATQFEATSCPSTDCITSNDCRGNTLCWNIY